MGELPPRVFGALAIAGAIATFATSAGDTFPDEVAWVSLAIAATFAVLASMMFIIETYPFAVRSRYPKAITEWLTAGPVAVHRRRLIDGDKVPVRREDFTIVWQNWCDQVSSLLRAEGFPRDRPYRDGADERKLLQAYYDLGLRNQALRHADEAADQGMRDREYREQFYDPTSAQDLWRYVRQIAEDFIEPASAPRRSSKGD